MRFHWKTGSARRLPVALLLLGLLCAVLLAGCGPRAVSPTPGQSAPTADVSLFTPLQRAHVLLRNRAGYDRFYDDPHVVRDASRWFDLIYDMRELKTGDSGNPALVLDVLLYPKYQESISFWAYPEVDDAILAYVDLNFTTNWADETLVPADEIDEPAGWTGYGRYWIMDALLPETVQSEQKQQELLDVVSDIRMHIVVEHDGVREKEIVPLRFEEGAPAAP